MKQAGNDLTHDELHAVITKIEAGKNGQGLFSTGLQGIDAENTAPLFDDALESLVQQYGYWDKDYNVDEEYNRSDFRDVAIHRALWAILVLQGYVQVGEPGYGNWDHPDDDTLHNATWGERCPECKKTAADGHMVGCDVMDRVI